jgi:hypothetical protein
MRNRFPETLYFSCNGKELLKSLIGQKIIRMFHYYLGDHEEFQDDLWNRFLETPRDQIFSIMEGPLLIEFDSGVELSFFSEEPMLSIAFCLERNNKGEYMDIGGLGEPLDHQNRFFVDVNNTEFSNETMRNYLGKKITDVKLYRKGGISTSGYYINDSVISFSFEDLQQMVLGFNILSNDMPSIMSVVTWDLIPNEIRDNLFEVPEVLHFSGNGRELLKSLIGQKIVRMFRYYSDNNVKNEYFLQKFDIPHNYFFSTIDGELLVEFDSGIEIIFFADSPMCSIGFWLERNNKGEYMELGKSYKPLDMQQDKQFIDVNDTEFSNEQMRFFLYKKITDVKLYRKNEWTKSHWINDSIISFVFEDSQQMLIGLSVLNFPSIMSISTWNLIPADVRDNLFEVLVL